MDVKIDPSGMFTARTDVFEGGKHAVATEAAPISGAQVLARLATAPAGAEIQQSNGGREVGMVAVPQDGVALMWTFRAVAG
ncbi:hypothetical protein ACIRPQ_29440 [Streptomyces sp. NPDC101213]|uniref:hypothetical protein n=1 Tax=Streptomyces sp. NPDC101213 TaxID=3366130 RepID=UPI003822A7A8